MRGEHLVTVRNNKVQIKLPIRRNLTILKGRSATGKSTLIDLVASSTSLVQTVEWSSAAMCLARSFPAKTGSATLSSSAEASSSLMRITPS